MPDSDVIGLAPDPLVAFAYVSTPEGTFSDRDLSDLMLSARRFNAEHGVTGKLIVLEDGDRIARFAQWVEGPASAMQAVVQRVLADPRHGGFEVRQRGRVEKRRFPGWDMAIQPVGAVSFAREADALV